MKHKVVIISVVIILIAIISGVAYFLEGGGEVIDKEIPNDALTAKQLINLAKPYVDGYWENRDYQVGKISMTLDNNLEGQVEVWYSDNEKNRKGIPHIITVEIDTKENKILRIIDQEREYKSVPGVINLFNWSIDSDKAVNIAKETFKQDPEFDFTVAFLSGTDLFKDGKETWDIALYNEKNKKEYHVKIDAYTGDIYSKWSK